MKLRQGRKRVRNGAAAVEMAFILPLFLALIMGTIEASRLGMVSQLLHIAARESCRVAVLPHKTQADVQARVDSILNGTGIDVGTVEPTPSDWESLEAGMPITVTLSVPFNQISWLGDPFGIGETEISASATMSNEREN